MANENLGEIVWRCHHGADKAFVRMDKRDKLYLACSKCGIFGAKGESFQQHIKDEAVMYSDANSDYKGGGVPEEAKQTAEEPEEANTETIPKSFEKVSEPIPKEKPKMRSLVSGFLGALGSET